MEIDFLKKYFSVGDNIEIRSLQSTHKGVLVDLSTYAIVIEDRNGNPMVFTLSNIIECKKLDSSHTEVTTTNAGDVDEVKKAELINTATSIWDSMFKQSSIDKEKIITTNSTIVENTKDGVFVLTDSGQTIKCAKQGFVGYNRDVVGKRAYCYPTNKGISYMSLVEMTYGELYDKFVKAINIRPKPRFYIIGSIIHIIKVDYRSETLHLSKELKDVTKELKDLFENFSIAKEESITPNPIKLDNTDPYLSANCEIFKYYHNHH